MERRLGRLDRARRPTALALSLALAALASSCDTATGPSAPTDAGSADAPGEAGDAGPLDDAGAADAATDAATAKVTVSCPSDMVLVLERYCVDRYETSLVDESSELPLSPYYPPLPALDQYMKDRQAEGARLFAPSEENAQPGVADFPLLPEWQQRGRYKPKAVSRKGATPNAYLMLAWARDACGRAGKRLCTLEEWRTACRGEQNRQFPYGDTYKAGTCNVFREDHPGRILFGKVTVGMLDPRMNRMTAKGKPLLRKTGATPACASTWGGDAIYDMVGNLDEWIDDPEGTFAGGFYSRTATNGCEKTVTAHSAIYYDYSTGARCCADGRAAAAPDSGATP